MRGGPAAAGGGEPVADLHALHRLDAHEGRGEAGVEPAVGLDVGAEAHGQPVGDDLDDAAERVAVLLGGVDLGHHPRGGGLVHGTHRARVDALAVARHRDHVGRRVGRPEADHVREHLDAQGLREERLRHRAEGHLRGGLAGARALEHRAGLVEVVLRHAGEVGVAGTRPRQRGVARAALQQHRVDGVGGHHRLPLRPLAVGDADGDRATHRQAVPQAPGELDLVGLEAHPRATAVAETPPGELGRHLLRAHRDARDHALEHGRERRSVRLSRRQPPQHGPIVSRRRRSSGDHGRGEGEPRRSEQRRAVRDAARTTGEHEDEDPDGGEHRGRRQPGPGRRGQRRAERGRPA